MPGKSFSAAQRFASSAFFVLGLLPWSAPEAARQTLAFESAPCDIEGVAPGWAKKNGVDCGWARVPAHRDTADKITLRLWVVRIAARNGKSKRPPIIRVWGGPQAVNFSPEFFAAPRTGRFMLDHDVVFFDYRGLGRSEPKLACKVAPVAGTTLAERLQSKIDQYAQCRRQMTEAGMDLAAISSRDNAQDVDDIASVLGYDSYYIYAESYGSIPAFDLIRSRPPGLRAAVVGLPAPPNSPVRDTVSTFVEALALMQEECNRDAVCAARFPDMAGTLTKAMTRLERERIVAGTRRMRPDDLFNSLYEVAIREETLPLVPLAIETAAKGDAGMVAEWLNASSGWDFFLPELTDPSAYVPAAVNCADTTSVGQPIAPNMEAAARRTPYMKAVVEPVDAFDRLCAAWNPTPAARNAGDPAASDIPVLLFNAHLDPAAFASSTKLAAQTLPSATLIEHPGGTHSSFARDPCLIQIEAAFFANPQAPVDSSCTANWKRVVFAQQGFKEYVDSLKRQD